MLCLSRRWDGRRLDPTPRIPTLPKVAQAHLDRLTQLDQLIYNASVARCAGWDLYFDKRLDLI